MNKQERLQHLDETDPPSFFERVGQGIVIYSASIASLALFAFSIYFSALFLLYVIISIFDGGGISFLFRLQSLAEFLKISTYFGMPTGFISGIIVFFSLAWNQNSVADCIKTGKIVGKGMLIGAISFLPFYPFLLYALAFAPLMALGMFVGGMVAWSQQKFSTPQAGQSIDDER